jgi:tRNA(His) 5'-end guanylyltransferase
MIRLDGKTFSSWTKGLERPFDIRLSRNMVAITKLLVKETNALMGYTQSDEITLALYSPDSQTQIYFDGRIQKICSILSGKVAGWFNKLLPDSIPEKANDPLDRLPTFDCRVWCVPTLDEAANNFLYRERDATKNSIQMAARTFYSHRELHLKNTKEQQAMLLERDVNWNDYPTLFKRGTFVQRYIKERKFSTEEIEKLPAHHAARTDPNLTVIRADIREMEVPPFGTVTNRVGVIFEGQSPITEGEPR